MHHGSQTTSKAPLAGYLRGSSLLLVGRCISLGLNFAVQVLTVRYLSKLDYGAFAFALSAVSIGAAIIVFGLGKTARRFIPIYLEQRAHEKLMGTIVLMLATILGLGTALVTLVVVGATAWGPDIVSNPMALSLLLWLIVLAPVEAIDSFLVSLFAVFAKPSSIFLRRYLIGPGLKLGAVALVISAGGDVYMLAVGYVTGGLLGIALCIGLVIRVLRSEGLLRSYRSGLRFPAREVFAYSLPQVGSEVAFQIGTSLVVLFLEYFGGSSAVADYRVVFPLARLNEVVIATFSLLFVPAAARMFAKQDRAMIDSLYWQTAGWITVLSFPMFAVCFAMAEPITVAIFGEQYASSATTLSLLSVGFYLNAVLGYNAQTLKVFGRVGFVLVSDLVTIALTLAANLVLIPTYGALGAAMVACGAAVFRNIVNHIGLAVFTDVRPFHAKCASTYVMVALGTLGLVQIQRIWSPPLVVGLGCTLAIWIGLALLSRDWLNVTDTIPELARIPGVRRVFG